MEFARRVKQLLARHGIVADRRQHVRFGYEPLIDLDRILEHVSVVVDVGANEGQSALPFARAFPDSRVFAFEPVPETFSVLTARTAREPRIECINVGLGAREGNLNIRLAGSSRHNSLLHLAEPGLGTVSIHVTTGDSWAAAHEIDHIDVLKIDTEGYELEVLAGFAELIADRRVAAVLAECEFARVTSEPHTSFFRLYDYLTGMGMGLVTVYTDALASNQFAWGNALFVPTQRPAQARVVDPSRSAAPLVAPSQSPRLGQPKRVTAAPAREVLDEPSSA